MAKLKPKSLNDIYDRDSIYNLEQAIEIVKKASHVKFDESVDLAINLNVDPRHAEQNIRVSTSLPKGTGKNGKILGPKGLMPNPKSGTVTTNVAKAVSDQKSGMVELRVEKTGIIHTVCGKVSFDSKDLVDNIRQIYSTLLKFRPPSVKGQFLEKISISSSMGPGVKVNINSIG